MYIKNLRISNLRCFSQAELELWYPGRKDSAPPQHKNINLLLGDNGAGKTTILRAISIVALAPILPKSGFYSYQLVRRQQPNPAHIKADAILHPQDLSLSHAQ